MRGGFVIYYSAAATQRTAAMNMMPSQTFGNFGAAQPQKLKQLDFATHGEATLGGKYAAANRLGREAVMLFLNSLSLANLTLDLDIDDILQKIQYKGEDGKKVSLGELPHNPVKDAAKVEHWRGLYEWHRQLCTMMLIRLEKSDYKGRHKKMVEDDVERSRREAFWISEKRPLLSTNLLNSDINLDRCENVNIEITEVIKRRQDTKSTKVRSVLDSDRVYDC